MKPYHSILLLLLFPLFICAQDDGEVVFNVKAVTKSVVEPTIINMVEGQLEGGEVRRPRVQYRYVVLPDKTMFQMKRRESLNYVDSAFVPVKSADISFSVENGIYTLSTDSSGVKRDYPAFSLHLNEKYKNPFNWTTILANRNAFTYLYSKCIDTNALITIGTKSVRCYKVQLHAKLKRGITAVRTVEMYIDKKSLLMVKEVSNYISRKRGVNWFKYSLTAANWFD